MADTMIEAEGLIKRYGETQALAGVEFLRAGRDRAGAARPERRRQDHGGADPDHAGAARRGPGPGGGHRRRGAPGRGAPPHRRGRPGRHAWTAADRPAEPRAGRRAVRHGPGRARARAAELLEPVRADRRRRPGGQGLLGRHAAPAGPGGQPDDAAARAVPRRADHGPGPDEPPAGVGGHPGPARRRRHACCSRRSTWTRPTRWPTASSSSTTAR